MEVIVDYCILTKPTLGELVEDVKGHISVGWQPHGYPFEDHTFSELYIAQAMVKKYNTQSLQVKDMLISNDALTLLYGHKNNPHQIAK